MAQKIDPADIVGNKYYKLSVCEYLGKNKNSKHIYSCNCDCGKQTVVTRNNLMSGNTKSCGCLYKEINHVTNYIHGGTSRNKRENLYMVWDSIKSRCNNPNHHAYKRYGGRGIKMCDEWENDYNAFREWSINNGYQDNLTIDRIDNNGNYSPDNCRFVSYKANERNKNNNHKITFNGKTMCLTEWSDETGISYGVLNQRINIRHWPIERALTRPVTRKRID